MTDRREVMRMALEALEWLNSTAPGNGPDMPSIIEALRAAIDEPVPEPVAWMIALPDGRLDRLSVVSYDDEAQEMLSRSIAGCTLVPLYAHPPAPPAADADTITVRLTREQHEALGVSVSSAWSNYSITADERDELLASLGTFPDAAGRGKP